MELSAPTFTPPARPEFLKHRRPTVPLHRRPVLPKVPERAQLQAAEPAPAAPTPSVVAAPAPVLVESRGVSTHFGFATGFAQVLPVMMGYFPVSFALGIMAATLKLSFIGIACMSFFVYAGSAQFAAVSLLGAGASAWTIILTVFIVNFRHFLMSLALAPHFSSWPRLKRALFGLQLTDETFAIHSCQLPAQHPGAKHVFTINACAHLAWFSGTVVGYWVSWLLPDTKAFGLDFAMSGMFIAFIVFQAKDRALILAGVCAAVLALGLKLAGMGPGAVLIAAILGATIGMGAGRKWNLAN